MAPTLTDIPPPDIQKHLNTFRAYLDNPPDERQRIPRKQLDRNFLIATWNIRAFGGLTSKWTSESGDSPKRDLYALHVIAEVVSRFDVVAIQEVKSELTAIQALLTLLGKHWGMIITDVTGGAAGNQERLAFLFDRRRVNPSGLACELVVPTDAKKPITLAAFERQFARTPYAVSFTADRSSFILVTLHVLWGDDPEDREPELASIAEWLDEWAQYQHAFEDNLIVLGDFNIDRKQSANGELNPLYRAFTSTGLMPPDDLNSAPRTIFGSGTNKYYDQIAWFTGGEGGEPRLSLDYNAGGYVDFLGAKSAYDEIEAPDEMTARSFSWRVSDHFPLWTEFNLPA
ncbi:MAG: endonuclease/exonuclease/phosphatase family protein [Dehalococcoidia bacterium]